MTFQLPSTFNSSLCVCYSAHCTLVERQFFSRWRCTCQLQRQSTPRSRAMHQPGVWRKPQHHPQESAILLIFTTSDAGGAGFGHAVPPNTTKQSLQSMRGGLWLPGGEDRFSILRVHIACCAKRRGRALLSFSVSLSSPVILCLCSAYVLSNPHP